jgi:hypothetical protein
VGFCPCKIVIAATNPHRLKPVLLELTHPPVAITAPKDYVFIVAFCTGPGTQSAIVAAFGPAVVSEENLTEDT